MNLFAWGISLEIHNLFLPRTEAGLSSTPCVKNIYGETISMHQKKPVFLSFLVKPVFDLRLEKKL